MRGARLRIFRVQVRLGKANQIGFLQLLVEEKTHVRIGVLFKHDAGAKRIYQDRERRKPIRVAVLEQRTEHSGRKIGTAPYRLGKDYVWRVRAESRRWRRSAEKAGSRSSRR